MSGSCRMFIYLVPAEARDQGHPHLVKLQSPTLIVIIIIIITIIIMSSSSMSSCWRFFKKKNQKCSNSKVFETVELFCMSFIHLCNVCHNAVRSLCLSVMCVNTPVKQGYVILIIFSLQTQHCGFLIFYLKFFCH